MDLSKLNALSTDTLRAMNSHIVGLIRQRNTLDQMNAGNKLRVGCKAVFVDSRTRQGHLVVVDKINVKSVVCRELDDEGRTLMNWKVSPSLLTPVDDRPKTAGAGAGATW